MIYSTFGCRIWANREDGDELERFLIDSICSPRRISYNSRLILFRARVTPEERIVMTLKFPHIRIIDDHLGLL